MPSIKCTNIGFENDPFQMTTATRDELMQHLKLHAKIVHNLDEIPEDLKMKIDKAIKL